MKKKKTKAERLLDLLSYGRKRDNLSVYRRATSFENKKKKGKGTRQQKKHKAIDER